MTPDQVDRFWKALEAERHDISYRQPAPQIQPTEIKETKKQRDKRDAIFYHAGRFIAGATDKVALKAHKELGKIIEAEQD